MEGLSSILILLFGTLLVFGVPIGASILIYRYIKKRNLDKRLQFLALIPLLFLGYLVYQGVFYPNSLYKDHFEKVTEVPFPGDGTFIHKENWTSGTYSRGYITLSVVETSERFNNELPLKLKEKGLTEKVEELDPDDRLTQRLQVLEKEINLEIEKEFVLKRGNRVLQYVGFAADKKTLIVYAWHK